MNSLLDLTLYLSVFALSATLLVIARKTKYRTLSILALLLPILLAGLRFAVGIDYESYATISKTLSEMPLLTFFSSAASNVYEPTMFLFSRISAFFGDNNIIFFTIYSALTIIPIYLAARKINPKYAWLVLLFFLLLFFAPSLNTIRQYAAIAITFFATVSLVYDNKTPKRKLLEFLALILLASLLHTSAICAITLPIIYLISQKFANKTLIQNILYYSLFVIASFFIAQFLITNIADIPILNKYAYALAWQDEIGPVPNLFAKLIPIIIGAVFFKQLIQKDRRNSFYFALTFIALATSLFGYIVPYGYRLSDYFNIFQILLFTNIISSTKEPLDRKVYIALFIIYGVAYFTYSAFLNNSYGIFPYQFIFLQ